MLQKTDPNAVRRSVLTMLHRAKASHLGSNMSAIEILIAMYGSVDCIKIRDQAADRSRIIVSKGHCAAAMYATMAHFGILPMSQLETYHLDGSKLAGHVSHAVHGVEHSTGALGHGINVAVGCALGLRSRGYGDRLVLTLVGDGEIQEGSVWEGLMLAVHQGLGNLIILVDDNHISSITQTHRVLNMRPMRKRFEGFGCRVAEVDGHSVTALSQAIDSFRGGFVPGVIICDTVKGKGVSFAEGEPIWHYRNLNDEQFTQAMAHLHLEEKKL